MTEYTPEQLRGFPLKDRWTPEESLALIEEVDGSELIHGTGIPQYVQTRADKVRWASCVRIASQASGDLVSSVLVQQMARTMYVDRERYTE
jgi:hypothetical protein